MIFMPHYLLCIACSQWTDSNFAVLSLGIQGVSPTGWSTPVCPRCAGHPLLSVSHLAHHHRDFCPTSVMRCTPRRDEVAGIEYGREVISPAHDAPAWGLIAEPLLSCQSSSRSRSRAPWEGWCLVAVCRTLSCPSLSTTLSYGHSFPITPNHPPNYPILTPNLTANPLVRGVFQRISKYFQETWNMGIRP